MICVSIGRTRHKMMIMEHRALAEKGAQLAELRIDYLTRPPDFVRLLAERPTPCVVTCRRQSDRGRWRGSETQRQALLRAAIVAGAEYVDLEDDIASSIPRYGETKRIVSHHNFDETPDDVEQIHKRMCQKDPDIVKLVTMANSLTDCVRLLKIVEGSQVPTIAFCMGELGMPSRVLCAKYGSPFTYASFSNERELAPGQISFDEMMNVYRFDEINSKTKVYGVIGDPIAHTLGPLIHNAAFKSEKINSVYLPFRVGADQLQDTLDSFAWLDVKGCSVTIPHKVAVMSIADRFDNAAEVIGASNTLFQDGHGAWRAANTDLEAALASLKFGMDDSDFGDSTLQGKRVLMLGAGGVARAIGFGMSRAGAALTITNRTHDKAVKLAEQLGCQQLQWENRGSMFCDILINCTPVGMHPDVDESPFPMHWLRDNIMVFDTIYHPENTLLLKQARERNCKTVSGVEMFVNQAAAQFERFTGRAAPRDVMRDALRRGISPVNV